MKIFIKAKPSAKEERIKKIDPPSPRGFGGTSEAHFEVWVKEPPREGRANRAIVQLLAGYFNVSASRVTIISGVTSKNKIIEVS